MIKINTQDDENINGKATNKHLISVETVGIENTSQCLLYYKNFRVCLFWIRHSKVHFNAVKQSQGKNVLDSNKSGAGFGGSLKFLRTKNSKNSLIMGSGPVAVSGTAKKQEFSKKTAAAGIVASWHSHVIAVNI
ncbi:unnamed protein product [Ceutorhynchus assimilis]|uniref:Uncharacterized protein n=1 Tax=Ceutorhynchus assimilis TaxID=467358 RepID=A0A9N9Q9Y6_9CUCU|nr:unnamed protein product [Ceutorhynchus assimilis]